MGRKPCCSKEGLSRGAWSAREDEILKGYITTHGKGKWRDLPKRAGLKRCGKSCRLRWLNYLRPDINRGNISSGEEELILRLHRLLGNRWSLIAGRLPGRTDNEIKNYWNTYLSKKATSSHREARTKETKKKNADAVVEVEVEAEAEADDDDVLQQPDHQVIRTKAVRCTKAYVTADHNSAPPIADKNSSEPAASTADDQTRSAPPFLDIPLGFDVEEFMAGIECCDGGFDQACGYEEEWRGILLDQPQLDHAVASALLDSEEECCENDGDDPMGDASGPSSVN